MYRSLFVSLVALSLSSWTQADPLTCKLGGQRAANDYQIAINLLREGRRLSTEEERHVLTLLEKSVKAQCSMAAIALADIKVNQLAANQGKDKQLTKKLDDEIYHLLLAATRLNEGWYEFAGYLLIPPSRHYDPVRGRKILEQSAQNGDRRAIDALMNFYKNGADGFPVDQEQSEYWEHKLEQK